MKYLIFLFVFVLSLSLASAVEVNIAQEYSHGDKLTIPVAGCSGMSTVRITAPDNQLIHVDQGTGSWSSTYHTNSNPNDGKYTLIINCADGTAAELTFCVDAAGCNVVVSQPSTGGRAGRGCTSRWSCTPWGYCDSELKQARSCYDQNDCQDRKEQTRVCSQCEESWTCTSWSDCKGGQQTRNCIDEHLCGTRNSKPLLQKDCTIPIPPGPQPDRIVPQLPPAAPPRQPAAPSLGLRKIWEEYKVPIVAVPSALIIIIVLIIVVSRFARPGGKMAYNLHELKEWIEKEKEMGTSVNDILHILKKNTGWKKKEVLRAFEELKEGR